MNVVTVAYLYIACIAVVATGEHLIAAAIAVVVTLLAIGVSVFECGGQP